MNHLPKLGDPEAPPKAVDKSIHFSPILAEVTKVETSEVFSRIKTMAEGLSENEAAHRLGETGPNVVSESKRRGWLWRLFTATRNPLVILLVVLATISFASGDARAGGVMALMVWSSACCSASCRSLAQTWPPRS